MISIVGESNESWEVMVVSRYVLAGIQWGAWIYKGYWSNWNDLKNSNMILREDISNN